MNSNEILTERYYSYDDRRKVRRATGVFVGYFYSGKVHTGFSRCNVLAGDKFDMHSGVAYAVQQSIFQNVWIKDIPANQDFWDHYVNFVDRSNRYFKQGLADIPRNDYTSLLSSFISLGLADAAGIKKLQAKYGDYDTSKINILKSDGNQMKVAEDLIKKIKEVLYLTGQTEDSVVNLLNSMLVGGIADEEGVSLLKKHFPKVDISKLTILKDFKEEKKEEKIKDIGIDRNCFNLIEEILNLLGNTNNVKDIKNKIGYNKI